MVIGKGKSKKEESVDTDNLDDASEDDSDESGDADTPTEDAGEDNESDEAESSETLNEIERGGNIYYVPTIKQLECANNDLERYRNEIY